MSETSTATMPSREQGGPPLCELRNIKVAFGGLHAVDGVTIDLYPGEVVALVGGNGAGKSTLVHTLSGAHPADSGEILINGELAADGVTGIDLDIPASLPGAGPSRRHRFTAVVHENDFRRHRRHGQAGNNNGSKP